MNEDWDEELDAPFIWDDGTVTTLRKVMGAKLPFEADVSSPDYVSPFFDSPLYTGPKEFDYFTQEATSPVTADIGNGKYEYVYDFMGFATVGEMIQNYKQYKIDPYQLTFLYENMVEGKSNFFGTFVLAKCGTKIKEYFKNITNNPNVDGAIRYHGTLHNYKGIHGLASTYSKLFQIDTKLKVSESDMKMLLTRELGVYDELKVFFDLDEKLADWLKEGAEGLEDMKFKRADYIPEVKDNQRQSFFDNDILKKAANVVDDIIPVEWITALIRLHAKLLAKIADLIMPEDMRAFLQSTIDKVKLSIDKVQESMQLLVNWSVEVLHLGKAFLMGVANGFISLIQTLLYIISFIIDSIYGFTEGFDDNKAINGEWYMKARSIMESMEDGMDWLSDNFTKIFDTVKHLIQTFDKEALAEFFHNLYNSVVNKVKALTKYDLAYFCGSAVFEIIIGVAIAILTGGGAVAAKIAANTATKAELAAAQAAARLETSRAWLKLIGREAISTVTFGLYDFFKFITHLLDKFIVEGLKGFKSFLQFLRNLLTKSGDEVADLGEDELAWQKFWKDGYDPDPTFAIWGAGKISHPKLWNSIMQDLVRKGCVVKMGERNLCYGASAVKGEAGVLTITENASITALKHEAMHFFDDLANGFPSISYYMQNPEIIWKMEYSAYMEEVKFLRDNKEFDTAKKLLENALEEKKRIESDYNIKL